MLALLLLGVNSLQRTPGQSVTLEVTGSTRRSDLMGSYAEIDQNFYGRPAYEQQKNGSKVFLYWLALHRQWAIGSPLGYNIDPWMFVKDDAPTPDKIQNTWNSRPKTNDDYQKDTGVTITLAPGPGPNPPPPAPTPAPNPPPPAPTPGPNPPAPPTPGANVCHPSGCNVCATCCKSYIPEGKDCDDCVKTKCSNPGPPPSPVPPSPAPPGPSGGNFSFYDASGPHQVKDTALKNGCDHVWYPTSTPPAGGWPVYQFNCGTGQAPVNYAATLKHIASHGFIAVANDMDIDYINIPKATGCFKALEHLPVRANEASVAVGGHSGGGPSAAILASRFPQIRGYVGQHAAAIPVVNRLADRQIVRIKADVLQLCGTDDIMPFCGCTNAKNDYYDRYANTTKKMLMKCPDSHTVGTEGPTGNHFEGGLIVAFLYRTLLHDENAHAALIEGGSRRGYSFEDALGPS